MSRSATLDSPAPVAPSGRECFDAIVIGAGIAGLAAAFRLRRAGCRVLVLEASDEVGGAIASARIDGHLFERGPTTVLSTSSRLSALIDDAGLRAAVVESRARAGRRLVWRHGRLHALPERPPDLLRCSAISPLGRLRLLLEPVIPARRGGDRGRDRGSHRGSDRGRDRGRDRGSGRDENYDGETLGQFFRRRLGREATAGLADPFVTGVVAGDLETLGVDAFPRLAELEGHHGSLVRGLVRTRKAQKALAAAEGRSLPSGPPPLLSFADGLGHLPRALARTISAPIPSESALSESTHSGSNLGPAGRVRTGCRAIAVEPVTDAEPFTDAESRADDSGRSPRLWQVRSRTSNADSAARPGLAERPDAADHLDRAPRIVIATPSLPAATLLRPLADEPAGNGLLAGSSLDFLAAIDHPPMVTVGLGYRRRDIDHALDAFGLLVASDSRLDHDVLGVLFVSSIFDDRAPEGEVSLTAMVGGSRDRGAIELDDGALVERVRGALGTLLGARGEPTARLVSRWPRAIAQYRPGHGRAIDALDRQLDRLPGLAVAGNWLAGVGLEAAVASGDRAAERVLDARPIETLPSSRRPSPLRHEDSR